jgi:hypothetical protein
MQIGQIAHTIKAGMTQEARAAILSLRVGGANFSQLEREQIRKGLAPFIIQWLSEIREDLQNDTSVPLILRSARAELARSIMGAMDALRAVRPSYSFRNMSKQLSALNAEIWSGPQRKALARLAEILPGLTAPPKLAPRKREAKATVEARA